MLNNLEKVKFNNGEVFNIVSIEENSSLQPQTLTIKILLEDREATNIERYEELLSISENTSKIQVLSTENELMAVFLKYNNVVSISKNMNDYIVENEAGEVENKYNTLSILLTKSSLEEKIDNINRSLNETNEVVDYLLVNSLKGE